MNRNALIGIVAVALVAAVVAAVLLLRGDGDEAVPAAGATTTSSGPTTTAPGETTTTGSVPTTETSTTTSAAAYTPVFEEAPCAFTVVTELDISCGYLVVPEDRQAPDNGQQVRIHVARVQSDNPNAPADPIVYLDGGPGGESLDPLQFSLGPTWSDFVANRDMIFFDQRGVGYSEPSLECTETRELTFDVIDEDLPAGEYLSLELDALTRCRQRLLAGGIDLAQYTSEENAADVADLRIALRIDEWNLLGISYGTRLAETVMRDHPEGIRSVILDSTYTPDTDLIESAPRNFARALDVFFTGCATDQACNAAYPNLDDRLFALVERLDADPLTARVRDVFTQERYDAVVDGQAVLGTVFQGLYSAEIIPVLPQMIAELEQDDTSTLALLATNDLANGAFFSYGMHLSVQCNEEVPFTNEAAVAAAATSDPRLEDFFAEASNIGPAIYPICDMWQSGRANPVENEPVTSDLPTLVMAGQYDPITPPEWGVGAARTLPNSTYVEFPGVGHGASLSGDCPEAIALAFIDNPLAEVDRSCVIGMGGPPFIVPGVAAPAIDLVPFEESVFGVTISGVVPDGWESVSPGAWTRMATGLDQTTIVQQAAPGLNSPELVIGLFASQLGFDGEPESNGTVDRGGRTWSLYRGTIDGFAADVALGPGDLMGIVVLVSNADERDALFEEVMLPALDAFVAS